MRTFARPLRILLVAACPALLVPACVDDDTPAPVVPGVDASLPETGSPDGGGIDAGLPDTSAVVTDAAIDSADSDAALDGSADATDATDAADAGVVPQPNDIFVNATSGSDSNTGAQGQPFKTLTKAMSVATSGKNVWLEDGTWNGAVDAPLSAANAAPPCSGTGVNVPAGVNLRAINPGAATIAFDGSSGICTDGGVLAGFKVKRTGGSGGAGLVIRSGTTAMAGVSLEVGTSTCAVTTRRKLAHVRSCRKRAIRLRAHARSRQRKGGDGPREPHELRDQPRSGDPRRKRDR